MRLLVSLLPLLATSTSATEPTDDLDGYTARTQLLRLRRLEEENRALRAALAPKAALPETSGPRGCVAWRNTGNCDPHGPREPKNDLSCAETVQQGASGYCECADGRRVLESSCTHAPFKCGDSCDLAPPSADPDAAPRVSVRAKVDPSGEQHAEPLECGRLRGCDACASVDGCGWCLQTRRCVDDKPWICQESYLPGSGRTSSEHARPPVTAYYSLRTNTH